MANNPLWRLRARLGLRVLRPAVLGLVTFQTAAGHPAQKPQGSQPGGTQSPEL